MRNAVSLSLRIAAGLLVVTSLGALGYHIFRRRNARSPEAILARADHLSWLNSWIAAAPLYREAEIQFRRRGQISKALYAQVSEMPAESESSITIPAQIASLHHDLTLPEAHNPETRLRILTILGMLETNYDAGMARKTWTTVEALAIRQHHFLLASRAVGEQGIAAFLLGDIGTAKKDVVRAWMVARIGDPAAHIRYASVYGAGLVELHKYQEALDPLNGAIRVARNTPGAAYPSIAITAKIEALSGLGRNQEALALAAVELQRVSHYHLAGHLYELYQTRAGAYESAGQWNLAISDLIESARYAKQLSYWRGVTQVEGLLAEAYLYQGELRPALDAIDEAIEANERIPDEMYFVPRDLALKAQIMARLGDLKASNALYEKSADMLDALLSKVPTPSIERHLLNDLSEVYAGHFASLTRQGKLADAFRAIERARGRVEVQALTDHAVAAPHEPNRIERHLTELNVALLNTDNAAARGRILHAIYGAEQQLNPSISEDITPPKPVAVARLQSELHASEVFLEYVLADPQSYVLAVTRNTLRCYRLPSKSVLDQDAMKYRSELMRQQADPALGQRLFEELLGRIPAVHEKQALIVVPDGKLYLLPFSALVNDGHYLLESHRVTVVPSGTVFEILRHRESSVRQDNLAYLGVAAWISHSPQTTLLASIRRAISGPERSELVALPESRYEVETIAKDLSQPNTLLLGTQATETNFKRLPLVRYSVIDLALHGYVNPEFPARSALIFAPERPPIDDGLLEVREILNLHLNASLVTLSACDTGVGPVGEEGVADIENAFLDAGAQSVVAALWKVEDQATAYLITTFYAQLARHEEKAEALRQAQLEMLQEGAPPYYWTGFVLDGDPNGSVVQEPGRNTYLRNVQ